MIPDESLALTARVYGLQKAARILSRHTGQSYSSILQCLICDGVATAFCASPEQKKCDFDEMLHIARECDLDRPVVYGLQKAARILSQRTGQSYSSIFQYLVYDGFSMAFCVSPGQKKCDFDEMLHIARECDLDRPTLEAIHPDVLLTFGFYQSLEVTPS